ncbi:MAG: hypothetical protein KGV50_03740 [Gammaproteobacteria bacterium]|nr:hypothetical protein [Gammaproteobacteria bacterium]
MILYIHGFLSSSQSAKAQQCKKWLADRGRENEWLCPDLPIHPLEAMDVLTSYIKSADYPPKLVGSSLGGFYATALSEQYNLKAVLVNPAVSPGASLQKKIGTHKAWHDEAQIEFTQEHVDILNNIEVSIIDNPENFLVMLEKGDEVLDYRKALIRYNDCSQLVLNGGDHSFTRFQQVMSLIDDF